MPVHPEVQAMLDQAAAAGGPPLHTLSPEQAREFGKAMGEMMGAGPDLPKVEDRQVPGPGGQIPIRVYTPEGSAPFPAIVYYHGGGWVIGDIAMTDAVCRMLAKEAGAVVVSVDYRLAPEAPFPAPVDDCYAATQWVADNAAEIGVDGSRIAVAGDSAGGNLAAAVAIRARDKGAPQIAYQLLIYPVTDYDLERHASYKENAEGYMLEADAMEWFWTHYIADKSARHHPEASPLRAESLEGLPPAYVITAEFDPLRDEGEAYADRLKEAGVSVTKRRYDGMIHGFFTMANIFTIGREAVVDAAKATKQALGAKVAA